VQDARRRRGVQPMGDQPNKDDIIDHFLGCTPRCMQLLSEAAKMAKKAVLCIRQLSSYPGSLRAGEARRLHRIEKKQ
jgi:hypothetical protein